MLFYIHIRQRRKLNSKRSSQNGFGLLNNGELEQQKKRIKKQKKERQRMRQERMRQTLNKVKDNKDTYYTVIYREKMPLYRLSKSLFYFFLFK